MSIANRLGEISRELGVPVKKLVDAVLEYREQNTLDFSPGAQNESTSAVYTAAAMFAVNATAEQLNADEKVGVRFTDLASERTVGARELYLYDAGKNISMIFPISRDDMRELGKWLIARSGHASN